MHSIARTAPGVREVASAKESYIESYKGDSDCGKET